MFAARSDWRCEPRHRKGENSLTLFREDSRSRRHNRTFVSMPDSGASLPGQTMPRTPRPRRPGVKRISLALQGGGSHGAFSWGVLHRLISEPRLYIDGLSGTSAGAMNAVVFADGFLKGSRQGAIEALAEFWGAVARRCTLPRSLPSWYER